jgi:hypothetical protein
LVCCTEKNLATLAHTENLPKQNPKLKKHAEKSEGLRQGNSILVKTSAKSHLASVNGGKSEILFNQSIKVKLITFMRDPFRWNAAEPFQFALSRNEIY